MSDRSKDLSDVESDATHVAPLASVVATAGSPDGGVPSQPHSATARRELVAGRYEIMSLLGAGGMGSVYKARDRELDELVALKILRRELVDHPGMLDRFRREVKLARRVTHANVARVFDIGEHGLDHFLTMEFVDGESLAAPLARGPLGVPRAVEIACAVLAGLGAAHAAGVIHRDLKPDNVIVARDGRVVVTDFGIARASESGASQTIGGAFLGTPAYMAPEQVEGAHDIDARADVYAFGCMFFEMLTRTRPWAGDAPIAVAAARLLNPPPDPRSRVADLPRACADVVMTCMARRREDRYPDAASIVSALATITLPAPVSRAITPPPRPSLVPVKSEAPADRTVAVVPFRNAGKPEDDYLADELTDELVDSLSMTKGLRVRPRSAVAKFKGGELDAGEVGKGLGVQVVVEGSVRKAGGSVRITARVLSVADGFQLWAKRFDRPEQEIFAVNDEVAKAVAAALTVDATGPARLAPSDPAVVDLYLRARHEYRKFWPDSLRSAIELYGQALALAPDDPVVLASASLARTRLAFFTGEGFQEARSFAERAVEIAPNIGESHLALGNVSLQLGDTVNALRHLKTAIARAPSLAEAHASIGRILVELDEEAEGIHHLETALDIDPRVPLAGATLMRVYGLRGEAEKVLELQPIVFATDGQVSAWTMVARVTFWRRDVAAAIAMLEKMPAATAVDRIPRAILQLTAYRQPPQYMTLVREGIIADPKTLSTPTSAAALRRDTFFFQMDAEGAAYLGDVGRALASLQAAVDRGLIDWAWLSRCPLFDDELRATEAFRGAAAVVRARAAALVSAYRAG